MSSIVEAARCSSINVYCEAPRTCVAQHGVAELRDTVLEKESMIMNRQTIAVFWG